jgi:hypothetical protein
VKYTRTTDILSDDSLEKAPGPIRNTTSDKSKDFSTKGKKGEKEAKGNVTENIEAVPDFDKVGFGKLDEKLEDMYNGRARLWKVKLEIESKSPKDGGSTKSRKKFKKNRAATGGNFTTAVSQGKKSVLNDS